MRSETSMTMRRTRSRSYFRLATSLLLPAAIVACNDESVSWNEQFSHPEVSLTNSNFEIDTDANLRVDDAAPSLDWANVAEERQADEPTGATDDSFGMGTKEDTPVPSVVDGSIPPNKSDLLNFGVYLETTTGGKKFLNLFWHRVQEPSGTTNMDFEFNQSKTKSGNATTPVRTAGDLLIQYDLSQGGTNPVLFLSRWVTTGAGSQCQASNAVPCWGTKANLTAAGDATGSINTTAIPSGQSDGLGSISPRTFGEAQIDFEAIVPPSTTGCFGFGSAYLKSRSSDSFTAATKDFIKPKEVNISNCGSIDILKTDDATPANPLEGAVFTLYTDNAPVYPTGATRGAEDTITTLTCTTQTDGTCSIGNIPQGEYWVVETTTPAGHDTAADQHASVSPDATVELTFIDPRHRGAIRVTKLRKHVADGPGDHPHAGVDFTINGVTKTTDANGVACWDTLLFGDYSVHETVPTGYVGEGDKVVTVDNRASCTDSPYVGEGVTFNNTPLSGLQVSFTSTIPGGTAAQISCTGLTADTPDATPNAFDDTAETFTGLQPGTYNCTVVVDP